jgi:alkylation response protein AidB-like acyl-CoA dehydrogenase
MWTSDCTKAFRRKFGAAGYVGLAGRRGYRGGGRSRVDQSIFWDEMEYFRAPGPDRSITYVPNGVMAFGTPEQKAMMLPRIIRGEHSWFGGYSESEAGSDLASLKTRGVEDGDHFVNTGQKAFSSNAHMADYSWLAARTDPIAPKNKGITLFIMDTTLPDIKVTEYPTLPGCTHHAVHSDNVPCAKLHDGRRAT